MADARPDLDVAFNAFGVEGTVALPGPGEFAMEPESSPITVSFHTPTPATVPRQLDAATYETWDWVIRVRRADAPGLRHGAIVRAPEVVAGGPIKRWFVDAVEVLNGEELSALVKEVPEP